jgi:hypothetical protein
MMTFGARDFSPLFRDKEKPPDKNPGVHILETRAGVEPA